MQPDMSDKANIMKNGKLAKTLDQKEVEKVLKNGLTVEGHITSKQSASFKHMFDDGSSMTVTTKLVPKSGPGRNGAIGAASIGIDYVGSVTGETTFLGESWTGLDLFEYTMYQDARVDGTKVTWYENIPYTDFWALPILSFWELSSEALAVTPSGNDIISTASTKFKFGIWELVTVQTISVKGNLTIKGNGSYSGSWRTL